MRSIEIPQPSDRDWRYRAFEVLPGALTWLILTLPAILGYLSPRVAAFFIIAYLLLWFTRAIALNIRSLQGWRVMRQHKNTEWGKLNKDLEILWPKTPDAPKWHAINLERVKRNMLHSRIKPSEVIHVVIVAAYNESRDVIEPTLKAIGASNYDFKKLILLLAYEQRGGPEVEQTAQALVAQYGPKFFYAEAVMHPDNLPGEVRGKGGNITYAARGAQKFLEDKAIDPLKVLVTTLDADNRPDKQYFAALTYTYCSTEEPRYASYQPIPMFLNNIWDAPAPMRVIATGNSFWMLVQSMRPHSLRNFSAHAQPMAALIDTDFWSVRTIVEDGHQYWRTYFRYDGRHEVYPIFVPVYQDAVLASSYRKTLKAQFIQLRRWAWGASDISYVAYMGFMRKNNIPRHKLMAKFLRLLEGHVSWSTAPLILALAALVPFFLNPESYLANQLPQVASRLQTVAMAGILVTLYLSMRNLPPKPERYRKHRTVWMMLQWIYLPVTSIVFSASAAIYSQTRLMLGLYLGTFDVTEKAVKKDKVILRDAVKGAPPHSVTRLAGLAALVRRRRRN
ncbi:glycosyltransferase family 2 protein [Candidatus Saccharibacteria bacterium]|nr:glycosyltransferase family 2 protein [Candidatus Saccharibacteria bacterium]